MKPVRDENTVTYVMRLSELIKRAISKGWNLDKFVEEAGQMEDTCLQMKDMKGDHRDHSTSSVNKIQSNRSSYRAQDFKEDRFKQNGRNITQSNCGYCGIDHGDERKCPVYGKQCNNCERYNPFASVCREEKRNEVQYDNQQQNRSVNYRNRRHVKKTIEEAYETDLNTDISDYEEDRDYFGQTIKHIRKIRRVKTIQGITDIEKKTVTVRIDDVDVKVEPDSAADVNVMDENKFLTFQKKT
ncbi:unnamed protein product [Mytilus coruscus]|uniref:Uncharacterized protein n=1 Tax=Mytilus coruscus TaxID=42192 RepID=A0A6J8DT06_MYTCO|nr:unnamed protein product [Mytilus coruscus]